VVVALAVTVRLRKVELSLSKVDEKPILPAVAPPVVSIATAAPSLAALLKVTAPPLPCAPAPPLNPPVAVIVAAENKL
jgi:hypothetical protein